MKYRAHNTQLKSLKSWKTHDKTPEIVIYDEENKYAFSIVFGKKPEISVWDESDAQNLGNEIHNFRVGDKIPSIEMDDLTDAINLVIARKANPNITLEHFYKLADKIGKF